MATNGKKMAMATATLVVQQCVGGEEPDLEGLVESLERSIDTTDVLRRVGGATIQHHADLVELRCDVEYGPILANEADMRRHLERQTKAIAAGLGGQDSAIFNLTPTELTSPEQLDDVIGKLTARSNDIAVPLTLRKQLTTVVTRLRRGDGARRVSR